MKLWTIGVLLAVAIFAAPPPSVRAQQPPLTRDQVLNLVRNQLGDEAGAKAIQQRGIDFVPAQDFLDALRDAEAKDVFLQALRASGKSEPAPAPSKKPISQIQIVNLLFAKVSSQRVAVLVAERGIDFEPTNDFLHFLEGFHAEGVLAPALQKARVIKPQLDAAALANQTRIQEHTARGLNLGREGKMAQAEQEFQAAVDLDPSKSELHFLLAIAQKA